MLTADCAWLRKQVCFLEGAAWPPDFLFVINRFVDCLFICDMVLNFYLKVKVTQGGASKVLRKRWPIAKNYLERWFIVRKQA